MMALDLCCGAGGLSLGLHRAGFSVHGVELDVDACETHRANVGPCDQADLWDWHPAQSYDLVGGGIPCQSHSMAGKRTGMDDPRGQLYKPFLRIAREANARVVLIENVKGLLSSKATPLAPRGSALAELIAAIIDHGFARIAQRVLCAADFGTPQERYRLCIIGFANAEDYARFCWPTPTHYQGALFGQQWVTVRQALQLGPSRYDRGLIEGASWDSPQGARMLDVDAPATTVSGCSAELLRALDRPSPTILATEDHSAPNLSNALAAAGLIDTPSTTVDSHPSLSRRESEGESNKDGAVRVSVEQLAILQGFPRDFVFSGATSKSRHRQVGNAVPPQLGEAVGRAIHAALYPQVAEAIVRANVGRFVAGSHQGNPSALAVAGPGSPSATSPSARCARKIAPLPAPYRRRHSIASLRPRSPSG